MLAKIKNPKIFSLLVITTVVVMIGAYYVKSYYYKPSSVPDPNAQKQAIPVTGLTLQKQAFDPQKSVPGRIVPIEVAELRPQVNGIISKRFFEEGSFVKEGDQLYQINPAPYEAAFNSAQANIMKAKANLNLAQLKGNRGDKLIKEKVISTQDYDDIVAQLAQAKADLGIAEASLEATKIDLNYTKVHAPISGHIGKSELTKGALVTANQAIPLALITQMDPIYVDLTLPIHDFIQLRPFLAHPKNIKLLLFLENKLTPYPYEGKIQFTDITVNETTNSILLRTLFPNPQKILLPGLFVNAKIQLAATESILIPQRAVIHNPDGSANVWIIKNQNNQTIAQPQTIKLEQAIGDDWLVKDGISAGDTVVLSGVQKLKPGSVVIQESAKKEAP